MQRNTDSSSDTHDHGPPRSPAAYPAGGNRANEHHPFARYAVKISPVAVNSFCGAAAGTMSGIVTCPLDVIKTKLQAQGGFSNIQPGQSGSTRALYSGMIGTARVILRQDGFRGLYRGLSPMLLGYQPTWAVYMAAYEVSKNFYKGRIENEWFAKGFASITAGACSTLVTNPIWVIKTRLMSQISRSASDGARTPWYYNNTMDAARKMWTNEGIGAFYSGLAPALLGLTHVAIQFPLYEYLRVHFTGLEMGETAGKDASPGRETLGTAAATFLSKVCATSATYPHEVLRTRLQTQQRIHPAGSPDGLTHTGKDANARVPPGGASSDGMINRPRYQGMIKTCRLILAEEGWRAFYNGMGTNMIRAVPAAMTTMLTYEALKGWIVRLQDEGKSSAE